MAKRTSPLESSAKSSYHVEFRLNFEAVGICTFFMETGVVQDIWRILSGSQCATCHVHI